jgi:transposase
MYHYFAILRHELYREGPLIVILDVYAAHYSPEVREIARLWEIQLVFIPPGYTDKLQPLDRCIFGILKSYAR